MQKCHSRPESRRRLGSLARCRRRCDRPRPFPRRQVHRRRSRDPPLPFFRPSAPRRPWYPHHRRSPFRSGLDRPRLRELDPETAAGIEGRMLADWADDRDHSVDRGRDGPVQGHARVALHGHRLVSQIYPFPLLCGARLSHRSLTRLLAPATASRQPKTASSSLVRSRPVLAFCYQR